MIRSVYIQEECSPASPETLLDLRRMIISQNVGISQLKEDMDKTNVTLRVLSAEKVTLIASKILKEWGHKTNKPNTSDDEMLKGEYTRLSRAKNVRELLKGSRWTEDILVREAVELRNRRNDIAHLKTDLAAEVQQARLAYIPHLQGCTETKLAVFVVENASQFLKTVSPRPSYLHQRK